MSRPNFEDLRDQNSTFQALALFDAGTVSVKAGGNNLRVGMTWGSRDLLGGVLETQPRLGRAFLPDEQREVFLMREIANLPFEDIASITECPTNTFKIRMRYALDRLRDALSNFEEYARALR